MPQNVKLQILTHPLSIQKHMKPKFLVNVLIEKTADLSNEKRRKSKNAIAPKAKINLQKKLEKHEIFTRVYLLAKKLKLVVQEH